MSTIDPEYERHKKALITNDLVGVQKVLAGEVGSTYVPVPLGSIREGGILLVTPSNARQAEILLGHYFAKQYLPGSI